MQGQSTLVLLIVFGTAAALVWLAGVRLSDATDVLSERLRLGEDLAGAVFLAFTTNLPELAIVTAAAATGRFEVAVGNVIGGIALQVVVLALLDAVSDRERSLSRTGASLTVILEAALVIAVLAVAVMGMLLPGIVVLGRFTPDGVAILTVWLGGLWLVSRARRGLPWKDSGTPVDEDTARLRRLLRERAGTARRVSTVRAWVMLVGAGAVMFASGVALDLSSETLAGRFGIDGVIFGATILAAVTALPEVSTGIESVRLGDFRLAFADIFGGNAFLPVLFPIATLLSGKAVLSSASPVHIYLSVLAMLLTSVYIAGIVFRPQRDHLRLGPDSWTVLVLYALGMVGLAFIR